MYLRNIGLLSHLSQILYQSYYCRAGDNDQQLWEDQKNQREDQFYSSFICQFLGTLATFKPH